MLRSLGPSSEELLAGFGCCGAGADGWLGCDGGSGASTRFECSRDRSAIQLATSDCHQRPRHCSHHVTQKPIRTDPNLDERAVRAFIGSFLDCNLRHSPNTVLNI